MSKRQKRSGLEERVGEVLEPAGFLYEAMKMSYMIQHAYTPDFSIGNTLVEVKGFFRPGDRQKYKAIRSEATELGWDLVFVLQKPNSKVQKGAKLTMSGWCEKEGIPWFCEKTLEDLIKYALEVESC